MANMYLIIAAFITAIVLGRIIIPNILIISLRKRLFDAPDAQDWEESHSSPSSSALPAFSLPCVFC